MRFLFLLLLFSLFRFSAIAQELGRPFIECYSPKQYKAETQNWVVTQDQAGILYFGNNAGVLSYDGNHWRVLPVPNRAQVRSLTINQEDRVFVGAENEFGYLQNNEKGEQEYVSLLPLLPKEEEHDFGIIWTTLLHGKSIYFQANHRIFRYQNGKIDKIWQVRNTYHRLFSVHGKLYVRQDSVGLCSLEKDEWKVLPNSEILKDKMISAMIAYDHDRILIGTRKDGLFLYDPQKNTIEPFSAETKDFFSKNLLYHGIRMSNGLHIFSTLLGGLVVIDAQGKVLQFLRRETGLMYEAGYFMYEDQQNTLWVGLGVGIAHIEIPTPLGFWNEENGLQGLIYDIIRFEGRLYVSTSFGVFYLEDNVFKQIKEIVGHMSRFAVMEVEGKKRLLISERAVFEVKGTKGIKLFNLPNNRNVFSMLQSTKHPECLWLATYDGIELCRAEKGNIAYQDGFQLKAGTNFRRLLEDKEGDLWATTLNEGVSRIKFVDQNDLSKITFQRFDSLDSGLPTLRNVKPFWIEDKMVFGTEKGLYEFDETAQKFVKSDFLGKTLENYPIFDLKIDAQDRIWLTNIGAERTGYEFGVAIPEAQHRFRWEDMPFRRLPPSSESVMFADSNQVVWFGGSEGIYRYDGKINKNYQRPFNALIRKVEAADTVLFAGNPTEKLIFPQLPFAKRNLLFHFSCTSFENEKLNLFSYRLEGYDTDWSGWTHEPKKEYTNLPEGEYLFRLKAKNIYGLESPEMTYAFKILPPWYRTWFAYFFYFVLTGFVVGVIVRYYTHYLKNENLKLEAIITARTNEIREANSELLQQTEELQQVNEEIAVQRDTLQQTLDHLKATQSQLVQAEKMAGIGTLTAGIAHEINNPINFVKNNIENVETNLQDILEVVQAYDQITPETAEAKLLEIKKLKKKKDFDIAVEEMEILVKGIKEGANRTAEIVRSLRTFTRLDDQDHQPANLHENLDSTLLLLQNQSKDRIEIVKNYGQIPLVNCYIGKINQVFMNLLSNAMQAIEDKGTITISTEVVREDTDNGVGEKTTPLSVSSRTTYVLIKVRDTGKGIPEHLRHKIFEPFFTTKGVGKGTGLGLSISLGIAQNHGGNLTFESKVGEGTEFVLTLPVG